MDYSLQKPLAELQPLHQNLETALTGTNTSIYKEQLINAFIQTVSSARNDCVDSDNKDKYLLIKVMSYASLRYKGKEYIMQYIRKPAENFPSGETNATTENRGIYALFPYFSSEKKCTIGWQLPVVTEAAQLFKHLNNIPPKEQSFTLNGFGIEKKLKGFIYFTEKKNGQDLHYIFVVLRLQILVSDLVKNKCNVTDGELFVLDFPMKFKEESVATLQGNYVRFIELEKLSKLRQTAQPNEEVFFDSLNQGNPNRPAYLGEEGHVKSAWGISF